MPRDRYSTAARLLLHLALALAAGCKSCAGADAQATSQEAALDAYEFEHTATVVWAELREDLRRNHYPAPDSIAHDGSAYRLRPDVDVPMSHVVVRLRAIDATHCKLTVHTVRPDETVEKPDYGTLLRTIATLEPDRKKEIDAAASRQGAQAHRGCSGLSM